MGTSAHRVPSPLRRATRNLRIEGELRKIVRAFGEAGIEHAVLKGVPLARRVYDRIDERRITDNDVLVRRPDVERALEAAVALGYEPSPAEDPAEQLRTHFQLTLLRPADETGHVAILDLHWAAFPPLLFPASPELVWRHVEPFALGPETTLVPDPTLTIVHLASHFAQHYFAEEQILRDFARSWQTFRDRIGATEVFDLARELGLADVVDYAFRSAAARGWIEAEPPTIDSRRARRLGRWLPPGTLHRPRRRPDLLGRFLTLLVAEPANALAWTRARLLAR